MWIFSLSLLLLTLLGPFVLTALVGLTGRDLQARRSRLKGLFCLACGIYLLLVGFSFSMGRANGITDAPDLLLGAILLWGIPLSSSAISVYVFWGEETSPSDLPEIGFTRS